MQHLTEKELDILNYFYHHKKGHVRHIKKSVKLSEHTLLKYLQTLEKRKIIFSVKEGNLKMYEINKKSTLLKIAYSYFDTERADALEYKRKKALQLLIDSLKQNSLPYFALLFGSSAKGNYTAKSDIDIIIIHDSASMPETINEIRKRIIAETGLTINAITMRLNEFLKEKDNKKNYALQDAITTGYPIFGNQLYYEVVLQ